MNWIVAGKRPPPSNGDIDKSGFDLDCESTPTDALRRKDRRSQSTEGVEHDVVKTRPVLNRISTSATGLTIEWDFMSSWCPTRSVSPA